MDNSPDISAKPADDAALLPGAALAAARVAQGLSIEDISRQLKLSLSQIKSIEADDHSRLPSQVFVRGFIRSYARMVKLDPALLLPPKVAAPTPIESAVADVTAGHAAASADLRMLRETPGDAIEPSSNRQLPILMAVIACLLLGLAYYEFVLNVPPAPAPSPAPPTESPSSQPAPVPVVPSADATPELGAPTAALNTTDKAILPIEGLALKKSGEPVSEALHDLRFVFNGESWVEVRDGTGNVVLSRTNAAGTERRVLGNPPFSLVIGNSKKVQLTYNGKVIDLAPHATEDVARLRVE